jgi:hypothetical protein
MDQDSGEVIADVGKSAMAAVPSSTADTEILRSQIEETRAEMSETIDAIQERLRPGRLIEDAKASVKEATVGRVRGLASRAGDTAADLAGQSSETGAAVMNAIRRNPVPSALIGVSAGFVCLYGFRQNARRRRRARLAARLAMTPEGDKFMIP